MRIARRGLLGGGMLAMAAGQAVAQQPTERAPSETIPLWPALPEPAPVGLHEAQDGGTYGVTQPRLEVFRPDPAEDRKRAVLVIPGGGYRRLVLDNEGHGMAWYLAARGYTACVLIHRLPSEGWKAGPLAPLQDAQRGFRLMRSHAARWGVEPDRSGVIGFSAGGHLAGMLAVSAARQSYVQVDPADALPARPAWSALVYPVVSMEASYNHGVSRQNMVGDAADPARTAAWSVDRRVTAATPPTFLVHAADDPVVPVENSLLLFHALRAAKVAGELHVFQAGGHGFGLAAQTDAAVWPELFLRWIEAR